MADPVTTVTVEQWEADAKHWQHQADVFRRGNDTKDYPGVHPEIAATLPLLRADEYRHARAAIACRQIAQLTERLAKFEALAVDAKALTDISDPDAADIVATIGIADALAALASPSAKEGA